jgi:hypothetical protein
MPAHGPPSHTRDWMRIPSLRGPRPAIEDRLATSPHRTIHCEPGSATKPAMRDRQIGQPDSNTIWESDQQNQIRLHNAWAANSARWYPVKVRAGLTTSNHLRLN